MKLVLLALLLAGCAYENPQSYEEVVVPYDTHSTDILYPLDDYYTSYPAYPYPVYETHYRYSHSTHWGGHQRERSRLDRAPTKIGR